MIDRTISPQTRSAIPDESHDELLALLTGDQSARKPLAPLVNDNGVIRNSDGRPVTSEEALKHLSFDVIHPNIADTLKRVMSALTPNSGCDIVLLVAAPGAGKTHVAKAVRRKVTSAALRSGAWSHDMVPAILIEIGDEGKSDFDFKSIYSEICEAGFAPPVPHRSPPRLPHAQVDSGRGAPHRLRKAAQQAIKDRKTQIVMLDEAAHILNAKSDQTLLRHAKAVKTLANGMSRPPE